MEVTEKQTTLVAKLRQHIYPQRKYTIGVDGLDGAGKSVLARYLAWELDMPTVETDLYIVRGTNPPSYRYRELGQLVAARHQSNRPLIIEGILLLQTLHNIDVKTDFLIYVESTTNHSSDRLRELLRRYNEEFIPKQRADTHFITEYVDRWEERRL